MENILWISGVIGLAAAVQSLAGFGFALVAIALLPFFLDLQLAVPLVLVMCLLSSLGLWLYYWDSFDWQVIAPLVFSAMVSIPIGLAGLHYVPEEMARKLLGSFIVLYVAYDILRLVQPMFSPPPLASPYWAYVFGGISGFLTGALTTGGPPLVMYANSKEWSPAEFKGNLPGVYVVALAFALTGHYFEGHLTAELWQIALWSTPLFVVGTAAGILLSKKIDAASFKRIILSLLGVIGLKLIW
ncbi:sulfite exporter TauE/SafE family protein [cf. Phormidesmis sp. LEGE 11477]|uniref:sulfite exporter TauE/SafE family protein n=1 Tax=cf. Phormidesmis sp. LEGE 11477 TaxID=1828680 RepID=UPI00187DEA03|nr:sulfite exporter TauE/SafE family protein [cf. Phormidesmis sp. LEGE 11477]MBE9063243.1 sulfite exporter TauE/SafE family protein [cf. Phormidesmis sp. LEGE 11477]